MSKKRIAVLLSAYNGEKYLETQINSIICQQEVEDLTLIVRNDGSNDRTMDILKSIKNAYDNVEIINGQNIGLVASFLELLNYAYKNCYDYYAFSDQDDYWLPDKLSIAIKHIENNNSACMYASCSTIVDDSLRARGITQKQVSDITFFNSAIQNFCPGHNQVLNRARVDIIMTQTRYSPKIYSHDMWVAQVASVTGNIIFDNIPHTLYRQHANNQLSFGKSKFEWVKAHIRRLKQNEGKKIAIQLKYFCECFQDYLTNEQKKEIESFFNAQKTFIQRFYYILNTKMYRQKNYETLMFKVLYLFGGYSIE